MKRLDDLSQASQQKLFRYTSTMYSCTSMGFASGKNFSMDLNVNAQQEISYRDEETTAFSEAGFWNSKFLTPIEAACDLKDEGLIGELVAAKADITPALIRAKKANNKATIDLLAKFDADKAQPYVKEMNEQLASRALGCISKLSNASQEKLCGNGTFLNSLYLIIISDVNFTDTSFIDDMSWTGYKFAPIHYGAYTNDTSLITELLNQGVNINKRDKERNQTALEWATDYGNEEAVALLVQQGATEGKERALAIASARANSSVLSFFSCHKQSKFKAIESILKASIPQIEMITTANPLHLD